MDSDENRRLVDRWRRTGPLLEEIRWRELAALDEVRALAFSDALIEAGLLVPLPNHRNVTSGLVELQARFRRLRTA